MSVAMLNIKHVEGVHVKSGMNIYVWYQSHLHEFQ